ncbi:hypothetical protein KSS87_021046 [Heliosperma pusillum]|nr:hypothetical protein KSS87_021046 [Heliosperma pusillum]
MGSLGYGEIEEETMWAASVVVDDCVSVNSGGAALPLLSLNHVSYVCKSLADSVRFYVDVLGFGLIKRPSSFQFEGAWLYNYGIGIHLLESNNHQRKTSKINPKENHISFQCSDMNLVIKKLETMGIEYVTAQVEEGGIKVDQLFFHDPDGYMVEICNCDNIPILPLSSCPLKIPKSTPPTSKMCANHGSEVHCSSEVLESQMMESLIIGMMNIGF